MIKTYYFCDICGEQKETKELLGVKFSTFGKFILDHPKSTEGKHICLDCSLLLKAELIAIDVRTLKEKDCNNAQIHV
jgi:hypothetical protein